MEGQEDVGPGDGHTCLQTGAPVMRDAGAGARQLSSRAEECVQGGEGGCPEGREADRGRGRRDG